MSKTASGLVAYAKAQLGKPYWYGTFGQKPTQTLLDQKRKQYPAQKSYQPAGYAKHRAEIGRFDRVHDCVGLIKGYLWSADLKAAPKYNAKQDYSANMMRNACKTKGDIKTMPETPGTLVFFDGHVGVYIGGGEVIEARGSDYGVVKTALKSRLWTSWGLCPWVDYGMSGPEKAPPAPPLYTEYTIKPGDGFWGIAAREMGSGTKMGYLAEYNGMTTASLIKPGMKLKIPKG